MDWIMDMILSLIGSEDIAKLLWMLKSVSNSRYKHNNNWNFVMKICIRVGTHRALDFDELKECLVGLR